MKERDNLVCVCEKLSLYSKYRREIKKGFFSYEENTKIKSIQNKIQKIWINFHISRFFIFLFFFIPLNEEDRKGNKLNKIY